MRQLAHGPRKSGRTTQFIMELPTDMDIYVVAGSHSTAMMIKKKIKELRPEIYDRTKVMGVDSLCRTAGVDPQSIFFEHTAYEEASSKELSQIYMIDDMRNSIWNGEI